MWENTYVPHKREVLIIRQHNQQTGNSTVATRTSEERLEQRLRLECADCESETRTERDAAERECCCGCHNEDAEAAVKA